MIIINLDRAARYAAAILALLLVFGIMCERDLADLENIKSAAMRVQR